MIARPKCLPVSVYLYYRSGDLSRSGSDDFPGCGTSDPAHMYYYGIIFLNLYFCLFFIQNANVQQLRYEMLLKTRNVDPVLRIRIRDPDGINFFRIRDELFVLPWRLAPVTIRTKKKWCFYFKSPFLCRVRDTGWKNVWIRIRKGKIFGIRDKTSRFRNTGCPPLFI
jgi:hypothetical protein